jgi:hypothetical protein
MRRKSLHAALGALIALSLFSSLTLARPNPSLSCENLLALTDSSLRSLLKRPDTPPPAAIRAIIGYLVFQEQWDGKTKHAFWMDLVHLYNHRRANAWISSPCVKTAEEGFACWGDIRGHLLVFKKNGDIYKSFNPARPHPQSGADGLYHVDWSDPTLKLMK